MSVKCKLCPNLINAFNGTMVMLEDTLWGQISEHKSDILCVSCIQRIIGRSIKGSDLKKKKDGTLVPVNEDFAKLNNLIYHI